MHIDLSLDTADRSGDEESRRGRGEDEECADDCSNLEAKKKGKGRASSDEKSKQLSVSGRGGDDHSIEDEVSFE